ncbi:Gfo/Idh/MocA family oxidoreductase [Sandaracinus amylolyticus]|uniref:Gfo/Idh/MocA family oxidoreductase n=1 Tax=Sandaracinus amylolyticus TaxID=927083 RepID=UPI001EFF7F7B|nr:Gfo/Idh/MocA family oxidoreductase [Sandaracinus amylolyticus]UJR80417.1 Inositol 2-dehydrogenase/D-chiro-inositol 3-dehydrogenase [Sandaracinus amylolyticus]
MTLRLGILGLSEGNGHPYSWSAIFNGYDAKHMASCPFPAIPAYLRLRRFPEESLGALARVTHVWAQERAIAEDVARASRIARVVDRPELMVGEVDAVLLARDDAAQHASLARPFLEAGLPVYVDKPIALTERDLDALLAMQRYDGQIYSCSALRYASELRWDPAKVGEPRLVHAIIPKYWDTYAVHGIETVVAQLSAASWGDARTTRHQRGPLDHLDVTLPDGLDVRFTTTSSLPSAIRIHVLGNAGDASLVFSDSFTAFREALRVFVTSITERTIPIARDETRTIVRLIEAGRR